jgi:endo-1,4-beta-mannosidase
MSAAATRFGVNYIPSRGWLYSWLDWNDASTKADLEAIAALGCDHIRIQCLWPVFQPNPALVNNTALGHLEGLLSHANDAGLDAIVTVLNGWMSGTDYRPHWLIDSKSLFTDQDTLRAERDLIRALAERIGQHPRFVGFDIANEPNVISSSARNRATRDEGDRWVAMLLDHCEEVAPRKIHCVGVDHAPWLTDQAIFSRALLARTGSVTAIHAWPFFTGALKRYGEAGVGTIHLSEYMLELAKAYHADPARPVWLQEFGIAPSWVDTTSTSDFLEQATLAAAGVDNLWGITWWCSHDIDRTLRGFDELEYDLGLLDVRNEPKVTGERFCAVAHRIRSEQSAGPPMPRRVALVLPQEATPDLAFADAYFALVADGVRPAIVREEDANDSGLLELRGITELAPAP